MEKENNAIEILKNEYGISNEKELNKAIAKLGFLNISPFCSKIPPSKQSKRRVDHEAVKGTA